MPAPTARVLAVQRLLAALADNVQRYEAQHGDIGDVVQQQPIQFSGPGGEA